MPSVLIITLPRLPGAITLFMPTRLVGSLPLRSVQSTALYHIYLVNFCHRAGSPEEMVSTEAPAAAATTAAAPVSMVIPGADSLIGDLLNMDLGPPMHQMPTAVMPQPEQSTAAMDLLGEGLDSLVSTPLVLCSPHRASRLG